MNVTEIIEKFVKDSEWINKAKDFLADKEKMKYLLEQFKKFFEKKEFTDVVDNMMELFNYVKDIVSGKYNDYSLTTLLLIIGVIIYVVSPIDIIPDFIPGGFIDDAAVVAYACNSANEELGKYRAWKNA